MTPQIKPATMKRVAYAQLRTDPSQPRKAFFDLEGLAESIRHNGLLQGLLVTRGANNTYTIRAGERRYRAIGLLREEARRRHQPLPFDEVPCFVTREQSAEGLLLVQIVENGQRLGLRPWEDGDACEALLRAGLSREAVAKRSGKTVHWVEHALALTRRLAPATKAALGKMPPSLTTHRVLGAIGALRAVGPDGELVPDEERQLAYLAELAEAEMNGEKRLKRPRRTADELRSRVDSVRRALHRLKPAQQRLVEQVLAVLDGEADAEGIFT